METADRFTEREKHVINLLLEGKSNKQIALVLHISKSTVEFHLKNIYRKLNVNSRAEAILALSKTSLLESTGSQDKQDLWQAIGEESQQSEYSSQEKHFFDPQEEKAMKNRTMISISLSVIALAVAVGVFISFRPGKTMGENLIENMPTIVSAQSTERANTPRAVLHSPPEATTRYFDEVLMILQTPRPPFQYSAVFVSTACFIPPHVNCAFTSPFPFTGEETPGPVYWMPDGENGFYLSGNQILVLNHLERVNGKSDILVPEILKPYQQINISPDGRWLVEAVEVSDPYATDLVLIKTSTGRIDKLDVGLEECFKSPLGWMSPTKFMFRCDISAGATSKKIRTGQSFYTYDVLSNELVQVLSGMDRGFDVLSPNGKYAVYYENQKGYQIMDLANGQIFPTVLVQGQRVWSHDSSTFATFADNGDIYVAKYDGSDQQKIYSSGTSGYMSLEWFPDDNYIALIGYFNEDLRQTKMIILSRSGEVVQYDQIPTTDGYNIVGISPLPALPR